MDVALYLRKSRAEDNQNIDEVLARHKSALLSYCTKHKHAVVRIYEEIVSGESLYARPEMLKLLEDVEAGKYEAVACMDIDRLGRSGMRDQGIILEAFKDSDTLIITPDKTYDLNDESDEELTEMKSFIARRELKMINKRFKRGLKAAINEGAYVANAPFGYRKTTINKKPTLEPDETESPYIKMIFDLYRSGSGGTIIANHLNSIGIKPHRSDKWNRSAIMFILKNPTYIGKIVWNRTKHIRKGAKRNDKHIKIYQPKDEWTIVDGLHEPLIDKDLFYEVQRIIKSRFTSSSQTGEIKNPLAGLLKCSQCGNNLQLQLKRGRSYILCITRACSASVKYEYIEEAIIDALKDELSALAVTSISNKPDTSHYEMALAELRKSKEKTRLQISKIYDLLEQGEYSIDTYRDRKKALTDRMNELSSKEIELEKIRTRILRSDKQQLVEEMQTVLSYYDHANAGEKNRMLKSIIDSVIYTKLKKSKPNEFTLKINYRDF